MGDRRDDGQGDDNGGDQGKGYGGGEGTIKPACLSGHGEDRNEANDGGHHRGGDGTRDLGYSFVDNGC